jgi:hypothetical protein
LLILLSGRFAETGGIPLLIQLMYQQLSNAKLQCQFCWSLLTLSGSDDIAMMVSENKGDLVSIQSVLSHPQDASIQEYGLWTLYQLAIASSDIANLLKNKGILEICQIATENHANNEKVIQQVHNIKQFYQQQTSAGEIKAGSDKLTTTAMGKGEKKKGLR